MQIFKETLSNIERIDYSLSQETQARLDNLTKPQGSLGRLEEIAKQVVEITRKKTPILKDKVIFTMAGDHGVAKEGVSAFPQEVTPQMVYNFLRGGAGINVLARYQGCRVVVVDMGVAAEIPNPTTQPQAGCPEIPNFKDRKIGMGTKNIAQGPAMTEEEAIRSIEAGIEVLEEEYKSGLDIVGTGDMGIGNTTSSSAIVAAVTNEPVNRVTGRGTGIDDSALKRKITIIERALKVNNPNPKDGLDVLSKVGGFEIGGIAGVILGAASLRIPVVIDGFISGAGALIAATIEPKVKDYLFAGHCSVEIGHKVSLDYLGLRPILNLNMRLGEGTGAALAIGIIDAAVKILTEMATFESAGVAVQNGDTSHFA